MAVRILNPTTPNLGWNGYLGGTSRTETDLRAPWDDRKRDLYRPQAFPTAVQIMSLAVTAVFADPLPAIRALFSVIGFDGEVFSVEQMESRIPQFGPLSAQAPFSRSQIRRKRFTGTLTGFGKEFEMNEEVYGTATEAVYRSHYMAQLISGMHFMLWLLMMRGLLDSPSLMDLYRKVLLEQDGRSEADIVLMQTSLLEKTTGCISRRNLMQVDRLSFTIQRACDLIERASDMQNARANYLMIPKSAVKVFELELALFASVTTESRVRAIEEYVGGENGLIPGVGIDLRRLLDPMQLPMFAGLKAITVEKVVTDDGVGNSMVTPLYVNRFRVFDIRTWKTVQVIDHVQRTWTTVWESKNPEYPVSACIDRAHGPPGQYLDSVGCGYIMILQQIQFETESMIIGEGGEGAGMMVLGSTKHAHYRREDLRTDVTHVYFRAGFVLFDKYKQTRIDDCKFVACIRGATAKTARMPAVPNYDCVYLSSGLGECVIAPTLNYTAVNRAHRYADFDGANNDIYLYSIPAAHGADWTTRRPDDDGHLFPELMIAVENDAAFDSWSVAQAQLIQRVNELLAVNDMDAYLAAQNIALEHKGLCPHKDMFPRRPLPDRSTRNTPQWVKQMVGNGSTVRSIDAKVTDAYRRQMETVMQNNVMDVGGIWPDQFDLACDQRFNFVPLKSPLFVPHDKQPHGTAFRVETVFKTTHGLSLFNQNLMKVRVYVCVCV